MARRIATMTSPRAEMDLLTGGGDLLNLSVLASRAAAAARRVCDGMDLDALDRQSLDEAAALLDRSVEVVRFFETSGKSGTAPSGYIAAQVDIAMDSVHTVKGAPEDPDRIAKALTDLAESTRGVVKGSRESAEAVSTFFLAFSGAVLRRMGHVGEVTKQT